MTDIVKTAQRILKALHHQCVMADAIREQDPIAKAIPARYYQNTTRAAIATRIWRHAGRKVLAMHPEIVREVSGNAATTPTTTQTDGGNFLPAYLGMLRGKQPPPSNICPPLKTVEQLLVPCDEGARTKRSDNSRDLPTGKTTVTQVV
jgi:hypothetical protein